MSQVIFASPAGSYLFNIKNIRRMATDALLNDDNSTSLNFIPGLVYSEVQKANGKEFFRIAVQRDHIEPIRITYRRARSVFRARNAVYGFTISSALGSRLFYVENFSFGFARMPIINPMVRIRPMPLPNIHTGGQVCTGSVNLRYNNVTIGQVVDQFLMYYWNGMFDGDLTGAIKKNGKSTKQYIDSLYRIGRSERAFANGDIDRYLWQHSRKDCERTFGDFMNRNHSTRIEV